MSFQFTKNSNLYAMLISKLKPSDIPHLQYSYIQNRYYLLPVQYVHLVGGTITKICVHDSVFGLPGGMALAPWPLWQSNGTKNTSFQESSPESSPVQNPGPVQGCHAPRSEGSKVVVISLHNGIQINIYISQISILMT